MCRMSWNLGASSSWNPQGLSRPVMGLLYLYPFIRNYQQFTFFVVVDIFSSSSVCTLLFNVILESSGWDVTPCRLVNSVRRWGDASWPHVQGLTTQETGNFTDVTVRTTRKETWWSYIQHSEARAGDVSMTCLSKQTASCASIFVMSWSVPVPSVIAGFLIL
jgi:hypothetical protein